MKVINFIQIYVLFLILEKMVEELSSIVQNYCVLYDKAIKEFHRKDVKQNAWRAVAEQMDIEDGRLTSDSNVI